MLRKKSARNDALMALDEQRCIGAASADSETVALRQNAMVKSRYRNDSTLWPTKPYFPRPAIISLVRGRVGQVVFSSMPIGNRKVEKNIEKLTFSLVHGLEINRGRPMVDANT